MTGPVDMLTRVRWTNAVRDSALPALEKLHLLMLISRADETGVAWPSVARLALDCGTSQNTTRISTRSLEERGAITRHEHRKTDGSLSSFRYAIMLAPTGSWEPPVLQLLKHPPPSAAAVPPFSECITPPSAAAGGVLQQLKPNVSIGTNPSLTNPPNHPFSPKGAGGARAKKLDPRDDPRVRALYEFYLVLLKQKNPAQKKVTCTRRTAAVILSCLERGYSTDDLAKAIYGGVKHPLTIDDRVWSGIKHCLSEDRINDNISVVGQSQTATINWQGFIEWTKNPTTEVGRRPRKGYDNLDNYAAGGGR